ncbi:hypothetical protein ACOJBO_03930 [Rhizobium beringeri]
MSQGVKAQTRLNFTLVIAHEKKDRSDRSSQNRIAAEIDDVHAIDARVDRALRMEGSRRFRAYPVEFSSGPTGLQPLCMRCSGKAQK